MGDESRVWELSYDQLRKAMQYFKDREVHGAELRRYASKLANEQYAEYLETGVVSDSRLWRVIEPSVVDS